MAKADPIQWTQPYRYHRHAPPKGTASPAPAPIRCQITLPDLARLPRCRCRHRIHPPGEIRDRRSRNESSCLPRSCRRQRSHSHEASRLLFLWPPPRSHKSPPSRSCWPSPCHHVALPVGGGRVGAPACHAWAKGRRVGSCMLHSPCGERASARAPILPGARMSQGTPLCCSKGKLNWASVCPPYDPPSPPHIP